MLSASTINVKSVCSSGWQFPDIAKHNPVFMSRTIREKRTNEIISNWEENYSTNYSRNILKSTIYNRIQDLKVNSNAKEKAPEKCIEVKEHEEEPATSLDNEDLNQESGTIEERISERESEDSIDVLEEKYFRKWMEITRRKVDERTANLKKDLFEKNIYENVDLEEELWIKWQQTESEIKEMKAILLLHWTPDSDPDYLFQYSRYLKEYKRNPLKWSDSKYSETSQGLEVEAIRRWIRIEEMYEKLKEHFWGKSHLQDQTDESIEMLFTQKQKEYFYKIIEDMDARLRRNQYQI